MKKSVEIIGLPVISITEGRELGMSKGLLVDAKNGAIAAIIIEDEDWYRGVKLLPYSSVVAIGEDAVTVVNSETILTLENAGDYETMMDENVKVIGTKAITKSGTIQGNVVEIYVGEGGKIEKCEIEAADGSLSEITSDQISIFGKQVTIIDSEKKTNELSAAPAESTEVAVEAPVVEEPAAEAPVIAEPAEEAPVEEAPADETQPEEEPAAEEPVVEEPAEEAPVEEAPAEEAQPKEEPAAEEVKEEEPAPEPVAAHDSMHQAANNTTIDRQRKFILGKTARRTLTSPTGVVIVNEGDPITEEVIQRAQLSNMFVPLTLNVQ